MLQTSFPGTLETKYPENPLSTKTSRTAGYVNTRASACEHTHTRTHTRTHTPPPTFLNA